MSFCDTFCWKSSIDPSDDNDVDDADAVGESSGVFAVELEEVDGVESTVIFRLMAAFCGNAVVLILLLDKTATKDRCKEFSRLVTGVQYQTSDRTV